MADAADKTPRGNAYDKYATTNRLEVRLMSRFLQSIDSLLPTSDQVESILEIGVGEGEVLRRLHDRYPSARIVGIDLPDTELAELWRGAGFACLFADGRGLPFPDRSFDLIVAIESFEHISEPEYALAEARRVCRSTAVLSVPREPIWRLANVARGAYLTRLGNTPGHVNHWSTSSFSHFVGRAFTVEQVRKPFPWTALRASVGDG